MMRRGLTVTLMCTLTWSLNNIALEDVTTYSTVIVCSYLAINVTLPSQVLLVMDKRTQETFILKVSVCVSVSKPSNLNERVAASKSLTLSNAYLHLCLSLVSCINQYVLNRLLISATGN